MAIDPKEHTRAELAKMAEDTLNELRAKSKALSSQSERVREANEELTKANDKVTNMKLSLSLLTDENLELKAKNAALTESINQMNGEAVNKANEIARLKADADALRVQLKNANDTTEAVSKELQRVNSENDGLRNKLMDAEEALGRANTAMASVQSSLSCLYNEKIKWMNECANARDQIGWARSHPWRNLWEQIKSRGC